MNAKMKKRMIAVSGVIVIVLILVLAFVGGNTAATTLSVADAIVFEASLSFINAGIPEPTPTWGNILSSAKEGVIYGFWWQALFPGLAIMLTVLCLNILSEGITDAMVATPTAPIEQNEDEKDLKREEDRILVDPVAAYAAQAETLEASLMALKEAEAKRTEANSSGRCNTIESRRLQRWHTSSRACSTGSFETCRRPGAPGMCSCLRKD